MDDPRALFLSTGRAAIELVASDPVGAAWSSPSALSRYTVGGLAAHLLRAVTTPLGYLDTAPPVGSVPIAAAAYFAAATADDPLDGDLHRAVRQRAAAAASQGRGAVLETAGAALGALEQRLGDEPPDRLVEVFGGMILTLDEYLLTRLVELAVHADDLMASCPDLETTGLPDAVWATCRRVVSDVAARKLGDRHLAIALSRAERSTRPLAF